MSPTQMQAPPLPRPLGAASSGCSAGAPGVCQGGAPGPHQARTRTRNGARCQLSQPGAGADASCYALGSRGASHRTITITGQSQGHHRAYRTAAAASVPTPASASAHAQRTSSTGQLLRGCTVGAPPGEGLPAGMAWGSRVATVVRASAEGQSESGGEGTVTLLDYGAGNVRSIRNAIALLGYEIKDVSGPQDILSADRLIFPGVGAFAAAMDVLKSKGYAEALTEYIKADRPFLGICIGMQVLFERSLEFGEVEGLGIIPGTVGRFDQSLGLPVPHMGWNGLEIVQPQPSILDGLHGRHVYFVHSYRAVPSSANQPWVLATADYGGPFVASVRKGNVQAVQFHPEKSGAAGLDVIRRFLGPNMSPAADQVEATSESVARLTQGQGEGPSHEGEGADAEGRREGGGHAGGVAGVGVGARRLAKRVIACLDVRANDTGDLVVTKGDQYDVRESASGDGTQEVRNLGKPVELAGRYFQEGADEVAFLNITGFRDFPLGDTPMLEVMRRASERVFVPLTVGGGIRDFTDSQGKAYSSLEVAAEYFRSGADKVSIGSEAVFAAEEFVRSGGVKTGKTGIETISYVYGNQAVVVSIDPKRVWVHSPEEAPCRVVEASSPGPNGERYAWYQCTVSGGREARPIGAYEVARAVEALGAGEILLNCIDKDGQGDGFELDLVKMVSDAVSIPVIASSGAGCPQHFAEVFRGTQASAALAAGIFHRQEVGISDVKKHLAEQGIETRLF